jgi:hypothetical protein
MNFFKIWRLWAYFKSVEKCNLDSHRRNKFYIKLKCDVSYLLEIACRKRNRGLKIVVPTH